jgi:hypothetical protein
MAMINSQMVYFLVNHCYMNVKLRGTGNNGKNERLKMFYVSSMS